MIIDIQGHVLILKHPNMQSLLVEAIGKGYMPFSVSKEELDGQVVYQLSHPLNMEERAEFKWLYARKAAENKLKEKPEPEPEDDGPGPMVA